MGMKELQTIEESSSAVVSAEMEEIIPERNKLDEADSVYKINRLTSSTHIIGTDIYAVGVPIAHQTTTSDPDLQGSDFVKSKRQRTKVSRPPTTTTKWKTSFIDGAPNSCIATPLFEMTSLEVKNKQFKEFDDIKIYGKIVLIDHDLDNEFCIFDCKRDYAKTVVLDHKRKRSVILERFELGSPRCLPGKLWLVIQLKRLHGAEDVVIIDDSVLIDCSVDVRYDKEEYRFLTNHHGQTVVIYFTIFQFATLADVGVVLEKTGEDGSASAKMRLLAFSRLAGKPLFPRRVLHDSSQDESDFGNFIMLSTLAVPAYSKLEIEGKVMVNGKIVVCGLVEFEPTQTCEQWYERQIEEENYRVRVIVHWHHAVTSLPEAEILEWYAVEKPYTYRRPPTSIILKTGQPCYVPPILDKYLDDIEWVVGKFPNEILEIFSIYVRSYIPHDGDMSLKGTIDCYDSRGTEAIFDGSVTKWDISCNDVAKGVKLVPDLARGFRSSRVGVETNLFGGTGSEISNGYFSYDFLKIEGWYDRRICSVIRGRDGFAAVHYTIFEDAVQAKLFFTVLCNLAPDGAGCEVKVRGRINTWYSCYRYSTHYEKKFYRSTLFREPGFVEVADGEIPLSKSAVAVPLNSSLVVGGDVYVRNGTELEKLMFKETFSPKERSDDKFFKFGHFRLSVRVEWVQRLSQPPPINIRPQCMVFR